MGQGPEDLRMFAAADVDERHEPGDFAPIDMSLEGGMKAGKPRSREWSWLEEVRGRFLAERRCGQTDVEHGGLLRTW
jgi:hypothetical protein